LLLFKAAAPSLLRYVHPGLRDEQIQARVLLKRNEISNRIYKNLILSWTISGSAKIRKGGPHVPT